MKRLLALLLLIIAAFSQSEAAEYDIPPSIRFTLDREEGFTPIIYYFSTPDQQLAVQRKIY